MTENNRKLEKNVCAKISFLVENWGVRKNEIDYRRNRKYLP